MFLGVKFAPEHDAAIRKMFPARFGVEKRILLRPDFFSTAESYVFWKSTLQRMAYISKLGFGVSDKGPNVGPDISKRAVTIDLKLWKYENT